MEVLSDQWPTIPETIAGLCGVIYFSAWSISFYPQVILNFKRGRTEGLSPDFAYINPVGFLALTIWNWGMHFSPVARWQYSERHGGHDPQVSASDLAFSLHALIISLVILFQVWYYDYRNTRHSENIDERSRLIPTPADLAKTDGTVDFRPSRPSIFCMLAIAAIFITGLVTGILVWTDKMQFLDWLYFASTIKLIVSAIKYVPQVILNWKIRSVEGFAIGNIICDMIGAIFSFIQLIVSAIWVEEDPSGIIANPAKLGLSGLSFGFDIIFLLQNFVWFRNRRIALPDNEQETEEEENGNP